MNRVNGYRDVLDIVLPYESKKLYEATQCDESKDAYVDMTLTYSTHYEVEKTSGYTDELDYMAQEKLRFLIKQLAFFLNEEKLSSIKFDAVNAVYFEREKVIKCQLMFQVRVYFNQALQGEKGSE